jgi:hypothetical protein
MKLHGISLNYTSSPLRRSLPHPLHLRRLGRCPSLPQHRHLPLQTPKRIAVTSQQATDAAEAQAGPRPVAATAPDRDLAPARDPDHLLDDIITIEIGLALALGLHQEIVTDALRGAKITATTAPDQILIDAMTETAAAIMVVVVVIGTVNSVIDRAIAAGTETEIATVIVIVVMVLLHHLKMHSPPLNNQSASCVLPPSRPTYRYLRVSIQME